MLRARRYLWTPVLATTLLLSCVHTDDPTGLRDAQEVQLPIQPALIPSPADAGAAPVNRIRAWAARISDGSPLGEVEIDVDPTADEWTVSLPVLAPPDPGVTLRLWALLLSTQGGQEEVQFSGRSDEITISAGQTLDSLDIPILRGPIANHFVTGVTAETWPDSLAEGSSAPLVATATSSDTTAAVVFWTALDSAVVSVTDATVTGVAPGTGRLVASAGTFADTVSVVVTPAPASVIVTPDTATIGGSGVQTQFTAVVLDSQGDTLPDGVTWSSGNASVASSLGDGLFEGVAAGTTTAIAAAASDPSVTGSGVIVVLDQAAPAVDVELTKTVDEPQPLADSVVTFTVQVANLGGGDAANVVVFDTIPTTPFASIQHAVSAGSLDGDTLWTIPTLAVGDTVTWTTTATVLGSAAGSTATNTAFIRSLAANDSTPANDTSAVGMTFPISAIPVVSITSPADSSVFDPGDLINFIATANDLEDGDLTSQLVWVSSVDDTLATGGSFERSDLSTGVHVISASAIDSDAGVGADTVVITIALITTPGTLNVPFGASASLPITLSEPARPGGVTLDVTSTNNGVASPGTATVFIPEGALSANATLDGIQPGTANVTVSHPQFGASLTTVSVTAELDIQQSTLNVPETFPQVMEIRLESQGAATAAPAGGIPVTLVARDPGCVAVPGSTQIDGGLVSVDVTVGIGPSPPDIPCSSWVVATSPSLDADSVRVNINAAPNLTFNALPDVGSGLQDGALSVSLGASNHGGVTVRVTSQDPSRLLLAPTSTVVGSPFLDIIVPNGNGSFTYYVQALEGVTGPVELTASAPGFNDGVDTITVVTPAFEIRNANVNTTAFAGEDPFLVRIGTPNGTNANLVRLQSVRPGGDTLSVTVTSSDPAVGQLWSLADSVSPVTVSIAPGEFNTRGSVASGGVSFFPASQGTTTLTSSIPGFAGTDLATQPITVSTPGMSATGREVASGLMQSAPWAVLDAAAHGGITVTISSRDPSLMLVSPDENTAGAASIDVAVPNGSNVARYWIHGLESVTGTTWVDVSAPGFMPDSAVATIIEPVVDLVGIVGTTTSFTPDDAFRGRVGRSNAAQTNLLETQPVRAGAPPLTLTFTSSDPGVADLLTLPDSSAPVTLQLFAGQSQTPSSVASGGAAISPVSAGTTTIGVSIPGFASVNSTTQDVTVTAPGINTNDRQVGSGLQYEGLFATLGATDHPGVTVRVESTDPAVALIAPDANTPGSAFIDVPVATGQNRVNYVLQGIEGQTDSVPVVFSAPGFVPDTALAIVQDPYFDIIGLLQNYTSFSPDDDFQIRTGIPFGGLSSIWIQQSVRIGADTVQFTVNNSNSAVAQLETATSAGQSIVLALPPGEGRTGINLASEGGTFDPLGIGTTTLTASSPGFVATTNGTANLTVSAPTITVPNQTVGAGLQHGALSAFLSAPNHGGVTVTLTSSNPSVFLLSRNDSTAGTASIDVVVPDGQNRAFYYVQGVEGADAGATITATANGFTNGVATVTTVPPALDLTSLGNSYSATAADDVFWTQIGIPNGNNTALAQSQEIRAGGSAVTVTFTSSDTGAAQLVTSGGTGATFDLVLNVGDFRTPTSIALNGVGIDPVAAGSTVITATIPGFVAMLNATRNVTITP
ncbi:MAG: hypothetical protein AAF389_16635 [Gemmatimonadota bacterium]